MTAKLIADLSRPMAFGGVALNTVTRLSGDLVYGCLVESFDPCGIQVRQYMEPLALQDGMNPAGVWLGYRTIKITGAVYGRTREEAGSIMAALDAVMTPTASGTYFGFENTLSWYVLSVGGAVGHSINARPNGLQVLMKRWESGLPDKPIAIPWQVELVAKDPVIS